MDIAPLDGIKLEYEVEGEGDTVLLVAPVVADGFLPLMSEPSLAGRRRLVRYYKRGQAGSSHTPPAASLAEHAADAVALLDHLEVARAHVIGHSTGASIALHLVRDWPERVQTATVLEPELPAATSPSIAAFFASAQPVVETYQSGDPAQAVAMFLSAVSGLEWDICQSLFEQRAPGAVAQTIADADTLFDVELPAVATWSFGPADAAAVTRPVLSVRGADTLPVFVEGAALLRSWLPDVEELVVERVGHLLHIQEPRPVAEPIAAFLARHRIEN